jgi:hypothetical protein
MLVRRLNVRFASVLEDGYDVVAALVPVEMLGVLVGVFAAGAGVLTGSTGAGGVGKLYEVATGILGSGADADAGAAFG